ncbi:hypothetical protein [Helicobacter sp. T3_23-1056]
MSKTSTNFVDFTYAFIFLSTKTRKEIAPFEAILCALAREHDLDFASVFCTNQHSTKPNKLHFFVRPSLDFLNPKSNQNPQNLIISFANAISENLPLSMDFVFGEIKKASELQQDMPNILPKRFSSTLPALLKKAKSIPTVLQTKKLLQDFEVACNAKSSTNQSLLNATLKPFFVDISINDKKIDFAKNKAKSSELSELVVEILRVSEALAQGQSVQIQTTRGDICLSTKDKTPLVMFFELGAVQSYMRVHKAQISLLGSFEKPSMKLCPKEVFGKEFFPSDNATNKDIECILAFEPLLALLGVGARLNGVEFAFVSPLNAKTFGTKPLDISIFSNAKTTKSKCDFQKKSTKKDSNSPKSNNAESIMLDFALDSTLSYTIPPHKRVVCDKNGIYIEDKYTSLNLFSLIRKHYPQTLESSLKSSTNNPPSNATKAMYASQMLVIYLSKSNNSAIWVYKANPPQEDLPQQNNQPQKKEARTQNQPQKDTFSEILHIDFPTNPSEILARLATYKNGDKLIANFKAHFGAKSLDFGNPTNDATSNIAHDTKNNAKEDSSQNLIAFFAIIAKVLGYCDKHTNTQEGIQSLLNNAKLFLRDKGPRIDYKTIKNQQGRLELDMPKILRSAMSFALAGVDSATLCYGVVDSLCEFVGGLARDMSQNYAINKIFLCGDMLVESIFLDKILHYIPKDLEIILPQDGFVDTI